MSHQSLRQGSNYVPPKTSAYQKTSIGYEGRPKNSVGKATLQIVWSDITVFLIGMKLLTSERFKYRNVF